METQDRYDDSLDDYSEDSPEARRLKELERDLDELDSDDDEEEEAEEEDTQDETDEEEEEEEEEEEDDDNEEEDEEDTRQEEEEEEAPLGSEFLGSAPSTGAKPQGRMPLDQSQQPQQPQREASPGKWLRMAAW